MLIAYNQHPDYTLILASNRDEFYARPTEPLAWHGQDMLSGLDLQDGGTWLAATRQGRIAGLTNVREPDRICSGAPSRGLLVSKCVLSEEPLAEHLDDLMAHSADYNGFNLVAADSTGLYYCSNRTGSVQKLDSGLYALSNQRLDTAWPKVKEAKSMFRSLLDRPGALHCEAVFELLANDALPRGELPDTGVGPLWERILAPIFINSEIYGTRTTSLILVSRDGNIRFIERTHGAQGCPDEPGTRDIVFST